MAEVGTVVIVGASLTGGTAAASLRDQGFDGRVLLIGDEPAPPYERPGLSKEYLRGEEPMDQLFVRPEDWWAEHHVETHFGERVHRVHPIERVVILEDGTSIAFDRLLVATGVRNRRLDVPGIDLEGIVSLRTIGDADRIRAAAREATHVVIVGMGFIGAEVAASLRTMGLDVTVVEIFETALYRILGSTIGKALEVIHRDQGVAMHFRETVERFEGDGRLERVVTRGGTTIPCDFAVVGVGTEPVAEVMHGEGVAANGGIAVGPTLETSFPGVFAAGDVAHHDHPVFGPIRVEHFDNAVKMGEHAAKNLMGGAEVFDDPHWFWSDQYDHQIQMGGFAPSFARMVVRGSIEDRRFCAFMLDEGGVLRGSVSLDWPRDVRRSLPLIRAQVTPEPSALADPEVDLRTLVPKEG